ncbi:hypothetical protein AB0J21_02380 [Streptomyces sp. NPDC049954]|uniref:hypothetical protein n=1 Tax=Streptomyces sp. NPDC049954 TaxID=3155779 RepID=UPI00344474FD
MRAAALAALVPLERLDAEPYLVDIRSQFAHCADWAAEAGHRVTQEILGHRLDPLHPLLWSDVDAGEVDVFVVASPAALDRAVHPAEEFRAQCARRSVALAFADRPEPRYDPGHKARIHRRLSMPTAGYDGC